MLLADNEPFLIPSDVARQLGVHPSAVIRWMNRGTLRPDGSRIRLQHIKLPGSYRIKQRWVDEYLESLASDRQQPSDASETPKPARSERVERMHVALAAAGYTS
jgi:hypothetical protein